jgi:formylglycine-generating enzyme required for sulfatase activity
LLFPWGNAPIDNKHVNGCEAECVNRYKTVDREYKDDKLTPYKEFDGFTGTAPVGSFPEGKSPAGINDLVGNVAEWTSTTYCDSYKTNAPCKSEYKVIRGSNFLARNPHFLTTTDRVEALYNWTDITLGFRCVKDAPAAQPASK